VSRARTDKLPLKKLAFEDASFFLSTCMKNRNEESSRGHHFSDKKLLGFLEQCDADLAEECRKGDCRFCGAKLHRAHYKRRPRGLAENQEMLRHSFCCCREGCRRRHRPASVRFLGRRVYLGIMVVLISAMHHGLSPRRMKSLQESLSLHRCTLERWRAWWLENYVQSSFWKAARARFMPTLEESTLPLALCEAFEVDRRDRLPNLLRFLSPLTSSSVLFNELI